MSDTSKYDAAIEAFEEEVHDNIKQLSSKDPKARMKAAAWLGEAGDPTAITMLKQVYKDDPDPKVRDAARYSLGMFRKLEEALKQPDQTKVQKLLEDVAVHGKMGRRAIVQGRTLVKLSISLLISAILVAVLAMVVPPIFRQSVTKVIEQGTNAPTAVPAAASKDRAGILTDLQAALTLVSTNTAKLQTQYQGMLGGGALDCAQFFDTVTPITLSADNARDFADLATLATDINNLGTALQSAKAAYDRVCVKGEKLTGGDFGGPMGEVVKLLQSIATTQTALTSAAAVKPS